MPLISGEQSLGENPEVGRIVEVKYKNLDPKDSILQIDPIQLTLVLKSLGYPESLMNPIVLDGTKSENPRSQPFGEWVARERSVHIYQESYISALSEFHTEITEELAEMQNGKNAKKKHRYV